MRMRNFFQTLPAIFVFACIALGQADRGTLSGTITDPQGAVMPGVAITLTSTTTGSQFKTQTTDTGNYTIPGLPASSYALSVEHPGFQKFSQSGIRVMVAQTLRVDIVLQVGTTTESVTVTADASLLRTESAEQSTVITSEKINDLPLRAFGSGAIRNPFAFVITSPGVQGESVWNLQVNGSPANRFRILLDGQDHGSTRGPSTYQDLQGSLEAVEEFAILTNSFSAEYGQVGSGLLNMTSRSGTNQYHGSAYDIMMNEAWNADTPYSHARARARQHDRGGNIGGPLRIPKLYNGTNRTFIFFNYEEFRNFRTDIRYLSVPSEAYRNGDFKWLLSGRNLGTDIVGRPILDGVIYDPRTDRTVSGRIVRDPFPGNSVPSSLFDPMALKIQNLVPKPNVNVPGGAPVNNYQSRYPIPEFQGAPSVKFDHSFSSAAKVSVYWHYNWQDRLTGPDGWPDPLGVMRRLLIGTHTVRINYDHTFTPTLINHLGLGHQHFRNSDSTPWTDYDSLKELGLKGAMVGGFPRIRGYGFNNLGPSNRGLDQQEKPTIIESLIWVRGKHTHKFGGEWRQDPFIRRSSPSAIGTYNFAAAETGLPATEGQSLSGGSIGYGYASFLMGLVNSANISNPSDLTFNRLSLGLYAQDTWRITRKLTLDYGLRYDYQPQFRENHYRNTMWSPDVKNPSAGNLPGGALFEGYGPGRCNCVHAKTYPWAFQPRVGIAYQINPKTVLRAGWGISFAQQNPGTFGGTMGHGFNTLEWSTPAYGMPVLQFKDGLSYSVADLNKVNYDPGIRPLPGQLSSPPAYLDPGARPARMTQWNISIQREITPDLVVEAAYVGDRGVWWNVNSLVNYNANTPERLRAFGLDVLNAADRSLLTSRMDSPQVRARGFTAPYPGFPMSATLAQALRPYSMYDSLSTQLASLGNTWYDSLQVKGTKRMSCGLSVNLAYTWAKSLGTVDGAVNNVYNRRLAKSITSYDQPHVMNIAVLYEVPNFGLAQRGYLSRLAFKGWTLGAITRYASGRPIGVPSSRNNLSALLFQSTRMNRVPGEPLFLYNLNDRKSYDPFKNFVLNPKAWGDAAPGDWGTAAAYYSDYRQARAPDEQLSIEKAFLFRERMSLKVRFEMFNAFNRVRLPSASSGNPLEVQRRDAAGAPVSGFGYIGAISAASQRVGQLTARFQF